MTQSEIHPARRIPFKELTTALKAAIDQGLVLERRSDDGLLLYVYTNSCVYDRAWDDVTLMARGLILDPIGQRVVATPFPKFFNLGENGDKIPDLSFETFEKLDGSLIILFHHASRWRTATKGSFNSQQATWAQQHLEKSDCSCLIPGTTYLAEEISPDNRIVVRYDEPALALLAAYDEHGHELPYDEVQAVGQSLGWPVAQRQQFGSVSDLLAQAKVLPKTAEGFVLRFENGVRLKVKGDEYRRIHALISRVTPLSLWEVLSINQELESLRRELPEEFWGDFDQIHRLLLDEFAGLLARVVNLASSLAHLSDKEVGLMLPEIELDLRPFIFSYRKSGGAMTDRLRSSLYRAIRPSGDKLAGYIASYAIQRVQEET